MDPQSTTPAAETQDGGVTPAEITPAPVATPEAGSAAPASSAVDAPPEANGTTATLAAGDLDKVRELVIKANPDVVPDLVRGGSIDELLASVKPAKSAYQQVAESVRAGMGTAVPAGTAGSETPATPPAVPAGGANNVVDPSTLAPTTKIAQGLAQQKSR